MSDATELRACLETLRSAAADLKAFTVGLEGTDLAALPEVDRRTYRALGGALVEISDLAGALPVELRARNPGVDWRGWIGLRDLLLADGLRREIGRLSPCIEHDLPTLLTMIHAEIEHLKV